MEAYGDPMQFYPMWRDGLRSMFEQSEEFDLADALFDFTEAFKRGCTPQEAYDAFDKYTAIPDA